MDWYTLVRQYVRRDEVNGAQRLEIDNAYRMLCNCSHNRSVKAGWCTTGHVKRYVWSEYGNSFTFVSASDKKPTNQHNNATAQTNTTTSVSSPQRVTNRLLFHLTLNENSNYQTPTTTTTNSQPQPNGSPKHTPPPPVTIQYKYISQLPFIGLGCVIDHMKLWFKFNVTISEIVSSNRSVLDESSVLTCGQAVGVVVVLTSSMSLQHVKKLIAAYNRGEQCPYVYTMDNNYNNNSRSINKRRCNNNNNQKNKKPRRRSKQQSIVSSPPPTTTTTAAVVTGAQISSLLMGHALLQGVQLVEKL